MRYITEEQAMRIHDVLVKFFAKDGDPISPAGVKSQNMLSSALFRPQTSLGGVEKYESDDEKAASLLCALIQNHPFHNGNKRTALVCTLTFYDSCGHTIDASEDDLFNFLVSIASNELNGIQRDENSELFFAEVVSWLRHHRYSYAVNFTDIKTDAFCKKCESLGASIKKKKGSYIISHNNNSIRISQSTRRISANAIKTYLTKLKLSPAYSGIKLDQLLTNGIENLSCFSQLLPILRRLALV